MTHFKLLQQLERDIRNQVLIDSLKRLPPTPLQGSGATGNRKEKPMNYLRRHALPIAATALSFLWIMFCITMARADELPKYPCPTAEPCKILTLTSQEERLLTAQNGILDTAAQGRALELGQFSVYLKTRIASAPAGEPVKPAGVPTPPEKHDAPESAKP